MRLAIMVGGIGVASGLIALVLANVYQLVALVQMALQ